MSLRCASDLYHRALLASYVGRVPTDCAAEICWWAAENSVAGVRSPLHRHQPPGCEGAAAGRGPAVRRPLRQRENLFRLLSLPLSCSSPWGQHAQRPQVLELPRSACLVPCSRRCRNVARAEAGATCSFGWAVRLPTASTAGEGRRLTPRVERAEPSTPRLGGGQQRSARWRRPQNTRNSSSGRSAPG